MQAIKFENVNFSYEEGNNVINDLSFEIEEGSFVALVGRNGSGKSTIAKLINGLIMPKNGEVTVFDLKTSDKKQLFNIRKQVGMVFQNPDNQMVATIVEDDVAFGPENIGVKREEIKERIDFALNVTGTEQYRNRPSDQLSGGQKQRVAIAGVLAIRPRILILDESTSMLDPKGREEVNGIVRKLNKEQGMTVITVTHYMEEALSADKVMVIKDGQIAFSGTPEQVFSREDDLVECGLSLPRAAYMCNRFSEMGIFKKGEKAFTGEELKDKLCEYLAKI